MINPEEFKKEVQDRVRIRQKSGQMKGRFYFVPWKNDEREIIGINEFPSLESAIDTGKQGNEIYQVSFGSKYLKIDFADGDALHFTFERYQKQKR